MNSCQYVVKAQTPKFIAVADKPLRLGGKIEHLALEEFQRRFGCVYNDGISIDANTKITPFSENITGDVPASQLKRQVEKILQAAFDSLVICNMGKFGHGVFASTDIRKDTVVAIYAGTIISGNKVSDERDHAIGYYGANMSFSTRHHRGIASFMQHLPEEPRFTDAKTFSHVLKMCGQDVSEDQLRLNVELYSTEFNSAQTKALIATENVRREFLDFNKLPAIAIVTNRDIKWGEQLGFNYGYLYPLLRNLVFEFFDKIGNKLEHSLYKRTFGQLNFGSFTYTGEYKPLINSLNQGRTSVTVVGDDKKPHEVSVATVLSLLLSANACRIELPKELK